MSDPEETMPFTHQPYGKDSDDNPFVSPSGPAAQPSGPQFVTPPPPPPPQVPYGPPYPTTPYAYGYQPGWTPMYGAPYPGSLSHKGATTSLTLGIISIASLLLTPFCCITLPGVLCAPFAWATGARAVRDMRRQPGVYGNLSTAQTGMWMGIVMTVVGALAIAGVIALFAWIGSSDPTFFY
ncbi:MAG TPA: hypothetical protein VFI19_05660 [Nocardioides sp.]|nr:hypothetical protein [Nocardioides sp.]